MPLKQKLDITWSSVSALARTLREEFSFKVQVCATVVALLLAFYFDVSPVEWLFVIVLISIVLIVEVLNTALEELCDYVNPDHDPRIGKIKDLGSGAAVIASIVAIIGLAIIFIPRITVTFF